MRVEQSVLIDPSYTTEIQARHAENMRKTKIPVLSVVYLLSNNMQRERTTIYERLTRGEYRLCSQLQQFPAMHN